ncbi:MAG: class I SAM-dependent methyltransferase [archaeon]|jgi:ubiquinone/menaquinone biosynthesis C-methylase UbiE
MTITKIKDISKSVKSYYDGSTEYEWNRLAQDPYHSLEWDTTQIFLKKHLPKKGLILDAGAGPGRYTIDLAKKGYDVVLLDYSKGNVELAKTKVKKAKQEKKVKEFIQGTIVNLSQFKDNSFDAIICLGGPLSHVEKKDRQKAINELIRVAKKNAPIFVSVMGKYAILLECIRRWPEEIKTNFKKLIIDGDDYNWGSKKFKKSYCHFFTVDELEKLFPKNKTKLLETVGLEGFTSTQAKEYNEIKDKTIKQNWLNAHKILCTLKTTADISNHMLIIVKKK